MVSRFLNATGRKRLRRALRKAATLDECLLWIELKGAKLNGRKFRRQQSIGPYVVDFYCPAERLIVELDGSSHDSGDAEVRDASREAFLCGAGFRLLRFQSSEARRNMEGVLQAIAALFESPPRRPVAATPPRRGGE